MKKFDGKSILFFGLFVLMIAITLKSSLALNFDDGAGLTPCIYVGSWCGLGNDIYQRYYPPFNLGTIADRTNTNFTHGTIPYGTYGEPLFEDFNNDGFKELVFSSQGRMYAYYWDGDEFIEGNAQTDNMNLYDDDLNVFEVDSGFVPDNNCSSEGSNKYIFAHNDTDYVILGLSGVDFCVANTDSFSYSSNMTRYKCFLEPCSQLSSGGIFRCVGLEKDYSTNNTYLSEVDYVFSTNNMGYFTYGVTANRNNSVLQEPRVGDLNSDGCQDFMFLYDADMNGKYGFSVISGYTRSSIFSVDNVSVAGQYIDSLSSCLTTESATAYHRKNLCVDYGFVDMAETRPRMMYTYPNDYTWDELYLETIDYAGVVKSTTSIMEDCVAGCAGSMYSQVRLVPFECNSSVSGDEILVLISSDAFSVRSATSNYALTKCVDKNGNVDKTTAPLGVADTRYEDSGCGSGGFYVSGAITNFDGDSVYDFINGKCIYEMNTSGWYMPKSLNYYTNYSFGSGNTNCIPFDFSGDTYLDILCTGASVSTIDYLTTSNDTTTNTIPFFFGVTADTCSPVCVGQNVTFDPSFSDNEGDAVKMDIDCNDDGIYEMTSGYYSNSVWSDLVVDCTFGTIGTFDVTFRLTDIYHPSTYIYQQMEYAVQATGNCYNHGETTEGCLHESEDFPFLNGTYCGDGLCNANETITDCPQDCLDNYTPDNSTYDYFEGCEDWDGLLEVVQPVCPLWNLITGWLYHIWYWILGAFVLLLVIILIIAIVTLLRREHK